jgi:NAD(P)-dependent dehydrogenase (short-subunit alcohol dehydrogenase family)
MAQHPALTEGRVAVITGAASGIGLAAAKRFTAMGLRVCLADLGEAHSNRPQRKSPSLRGAARRMCWPCRPTSANWRRSGA